MIGVTACSCGGYYEARRWSDFLAIEQYMRKGNAKYWSELLPFPCEEQYFKGCFSRTRKIMKFPRDFARVLVTACHGKAGGGSTATIFSSDKQGDFVSIRRLFAPGRGAPAPCHPRIREWMPDNGTGMDRKGLPGKPYFVNMWREDVTLHRSQGPCPPKCPVNGGFPPWSRRISPMRPLKIKIRYDFVAWIPTRYENVT